MERRRTQKERSAATRSLLLDATINCLFQKGYGATTTILVAETAGVSRGAMLHQFPSKADLMSFVVEEVWKKDAALYRELLEGIVDPHDRLIAYPDAVWKVLSHPSGIAVLEILLGARSDPALAEKLVPVQAKISANTQVALEREFRQRPSVALLKLIVGAIRGLSLNEVIDPNDDDATGAIRMLQKLLRAGLSTGLLK